jgi:hypothetical protein
MELEKILYVIRCKNMSFSHTTSNVSNAKKTFIYGREFWDFILLDHFNLL